MVYYNRKSGSAHKQIIAQQDQNKRQHNTEKKISYKDPYEDSYGNPE